MQQAPTVTPPRKKPSPVPRTPSPAPPDTSGIHGSSGIHDDPRRQSATYRQERAIVRAYLASLDAPAQRGGASLAARRNRLAELTRKIAATTDPVEELELRSERIKLEDLLARGDRATLQTNFVKVARSYGERKGISYRAWREKGVPPAVLREAGIKQTR